MIETSRIICGDALTVLRELPSDSINAMVTSPPYFHLRSYGVDGQLGLEPSYTEYINRLCDVFDEVKRVLRPEGSAWIVIGDSYSSDGCAQKRPRMLNKKMLRLGVVNPGVPRSDIPRKSLCLIPFRFAIEMVRRGWILRNVVIWRKVNSQPESMRDRFSVDFEYLFFFSKSRFYYFDQQFEPTVDGKGLRNKRAVWSISTTPSFSDHTAVYPEKLIETPIKAASRPGDIVLDCFAGTCTTGVVCKKLCRKFIGIELNPDYCKLAEERLAQTSVQ